MQMFYIKNCKKILKGIVYKNKSYIIEYVSAALGVLCLNCKTISTETRIHTDLCV